MTVGDFLAQATATLAAADIATARLDSLVLLEDALGHDRAWLLAHTEHRIPNSTEVELNKKIAQRAQAIPLAYLRGKAYFYGREFEVTPDVLVPRPESEDIIDLLKTCHFGLPPSIIPLHLADIGTGSGCLGITAALELPGTPQVDLYDIDADALAQAAYNAKVHGVRIGLFLREDLLEQAASRRYDVILANLPYVPTTHPINKDAQHEPPHAIFAGPDGLDLYRRLWQQIPTFHLQPAHVITESLTTQHRVLAALAKAANYKLVSTQGLAQHFAPVDRATPTPGPVKSFE